MDKRRFENTAQVVLPKDSARFEYHNGILAPLAHALVIGATSALTLFLVVTTVAVFRWSQNGASITQRQLIFFAFLSITVGCIIFSLIYILRDRWIRALLDEGQDFLVQQPTFPLQNRTTPYAPPIPVDEMLRVSSTLVIRLNVPPEWGIDAEMIKVLALRIYEGDHNWSRRALTNVIPAERYKDFSDLLVKRELLEPTANNSYALTRSGILAFTQVVVDGGGTPATSQIIG